jgi:hypothetical protein
MPFFQLLAERTNAAFNRENIGNINPQAVAAADSLGEIAGRLGIAKTATEREFLNTWPPAIQEALKAAVRSALSRNPRLPVTIAWAPGYDFELMVSEARTVSGSIGGITLFVRSRYPGD